MPALATQYADAALTNLSLQVGLDESELIADDVFPTVEVTKRTGIYYEYGNEPMRVPVSSRNRGGARANRVDYTVVKRTFGPLLKHALEIYIDEDEIEMADSVLEPRQDATRVVTHMLLLEKEKALADYLTNTANLTQNVTLSGGDQWSDYGASDPFEVIKDAIRTVKVNSTKMPNTLILGWDVWNELKFHPLLLDRAPLTNIKELSKEQFAGIFGLKQVLVGGGMYNAGDEGAADSLGFLWGKHAIVAYIEPNPNKRSISLGYTLQLRNGRAVVPFTESGVDGEFVKVKDYYEQKLIAATAGYLIKNAVA